MEATASSLPVARSRSLNGYVIVLAALLLMVLSPFAYLFRYQGRVYPGVYAGGVHLGGQTPDEALSLLAARGFDPEAPVHLEAEGQTWDIHPAVAGLTLDAEATVAKAYAVGRSESRSTGLRQIVAARAGAVRLAPVMSVDTDTASRLLGQLADEYDQPATEASFAINDGTVVPLAAEEGRSLNVTAGVQALQAAVDAGQWPVQVGLPTQPIPPVVTDPSAAMAKAETLLSRPITLVSGETSWRLDPESLAPMLQARFEQNSVAVDLDANALSDWLEPARAAIEQPAEEPRYRFDADTGDLVAQVPGEAGVTVDADATAKRIVASAHMPSPVIEVATRPLEPELADRIPGEELGITALLHEETSYYSGSSAARVHNIGIAAERFNGVLIPPGATFSFNQQVGDITEETGYKETLIIMDGATADGVGGGVCQVSTTLFRTAFWSGMPIVERHAHGYRVAYYEQGDIPAGLDATIYRPVVDLKFENDTDSWMLLETVTNKANYTLTFRLYGEPTGREVEVVGPTMTNQVPPPPARVRVDPSLPPGTSEREEYARVGADVSVERIVRMGDEERRDRFFSRYRPTASLVLVAPDHPEAGAATESVDANGEPGPATGALTDASGAGSQAGGADSP